MRKVSWLHISDLHISTREGFNVSRVLDSFLSDLESQLPVSNGVDFIICSGDLAFSGSPKEYDLVARFFDELLDRCQISKGRLFPVPGNHDIDRSLLINAPRPLFGKNATRYSISEALSGEQRHHALVGLENYDRFIREYLPREDWMLHPTFSYTATFVIGETKVRIIGLNSAYGCFGDSDRNQIAIGERQLSDALPARTSEDITIAIVHHPFDWLHDFDREIVEPILMDACDFILRGHMHRLELLAMGTPDSAAMVVSAGALYQGRTLTNSYNILSLDLAHNTGEVRIRRYSDERGGFWGNDTLTYRNVPDGRWVFPWPPILAGGAAVAETNRIVKRYASVYAMASSEAEVSAMRRPSLAVLLAKAEDVGISITFRSVTLRHDFKYVLRPDVTAADLANALAEEHFGIERTANYWHLVSPAGQTLADGLTMIDLKEQGVSSVGLLASPLSASRVYSVVGRVDLVKTLQSCQPGSKAFKRCQQYFHTFHKGETALGRLLPDWVLRFVPRMKFDLNNLAWSCAELNCELPLAEIAVVLLQRMGRFGKSAPVMDTIAWVRYRQGRVREARMLLLDAIQQTAPEWAEIYYPSFHSTRTKLKGIDFQWLYHLYFIHRRLGEDGVAAMCRTALLGRESLDPFESWIRARVLLNDDCLGPNDVFARIERLKKRFGAFEASAY